MNDLDHTVAALPANGWRARYRDNDGRPFVHPLLCWLVQADGSVEPVEADPSGVTDNPTEAVNFDRLLGPHEPDDHDLPKETTA
ncbi:hypothetical protein ACWIG4_06400 [Streptomyces sp. NPDC002248]